MNAEFREHHEPIVSVLIPAYQAERSLERAVRSALAQSVTQIEVLVLDDASTDATVAIARRLAAEDPRVHVLTSAVNAGPAARRNYGLDTANGTWVALLDADDAWLPDRLHHLLAGASGADIVCDDVLMVDAAALAHGGVRAVRVLPWLGLRLPAPRLLGLSEFISYDLGYLKPMLRRSALIEHDVRWSVELRVAEDFAFGVVALASGLTWRQLPGAYYCYRRGQPSLSSGPTTIAEHQDVVVPSLLAVPEVAASPEAVRALRRHARRARATLVYYQLRPLVRERAAGRLGAELAQRPVIVRLLVEKLARRARLSVMRRLLRPERLPEHAVSAVRQLWGLPPVYSGSAPSPSR